MGHQAIGNDGEGIRGSVTIEKTTGHRRTIDPADEDRKMSSDTRKKSGQLVVSELIALLQLMPQDLPVELEGCDCWTDAVGVYEDMTRKRDGAVIWHRVRIKTDHDFVTPKHCLDKVLTRKDLAAADVETGRK